MPSLAFEPVFFAVGGTSKNRLQRKQLLDVCLPAVRDRSFALAGSHYDSGKAFCIPSWIPSVLPEVTDGCAAPCMRGSAVQLGARDLLLVIGHLHDEEFLELRALHPELPVENVWIMGGTPTAFNLKLAIGNCIDNTHCPRYDLDTWGPLLLMYPEVLRRMRGYQWGGFFATRLASLLREDDQGVVMGAFYRQFNLVQIAVDHKVLAFEKDVLQGAGDKECFKKVLSQLDATAKEDMDGSQLFEVIYQAYKDNGPWEDEEAMAALTQSLIRSMKKYTPALLIKEYDSYVAHLMIRHSADVTEELTAAFHMRFLRYCLYLQAGHTPAADEQDLVAYAAKLRAGMAGRSVMVLHDLGLDPMSDDWLAVAMLMTVAGAPPSNDVVEQSKRARFWTR